MFKCGFCGKEYTDFQEYIKCVNECGVLKKRREEEERKEQLAKERKERYDEIRVLVDRIETLEKEFRKKARQYNADYNSNLFFWML